MKPQVEYYLILLDIKHSVRLSEKKASSLQDRLLNLLGELNRELNPVVALQISYGDEIAGIFSSPINFLEIIEKLRDILYPDVLFRFVVMKGKISVLSQDIRKVGGEIFKKADKAIKRLKIENRFSAWLIGDSVRDAALTSLTELSNAVIGDMTDYQHEVFLLLKRKFAQKDIAKKLEKHPQSVSDTIRRGKAELVIEAHRAIKLLLKES